jgi:hypothetical protein
MTAPDEQLGDDPDRRGNGRVEILGDLQGEIMVYEPMTVRELSHGGALLETTFPLQLDSLHEVRLTLGAASVIVKARVVHCTISEMDREGVIYRSGVEFTELPSRVQQAVLQFIDAVRSGRLAR